LGGCRRRRPVLESSFAEQEMLRDGNSCLSLTFEEGGISPSDARFVLRSVLQGDSDRGWAFNYCRLHGGGFDARQHCWRLHLEDRLTGRVVAARARWVVNAAGVGADRLNAAFGVEAPYRHMFSKGVFLVLPRHPTHDSALVFNGDFLAWSPWGPRALWGPTETVEADLDAASAPEAEDIRYLLSELNRYAGRTYTTRDVISLRCGVRPIAVRRDSPDIDSRLFSRRARLVFEHERPWVSVYGGNITYAPLLARQFAAALRRRLSPAQRAPRNGAVAAGGEADAAPQIVFPGLPGTVPAPAWCAGHEECWHLEDYLRRRTNIAQWVPRAGLGVAGEHRPFLERLARDICGAEEPARKAVEEYALRIAREHGGLLEGV
jgi:glycerol-3-phosphate dehydrogenase